MNDMLMTITETTTKRQFDQALRRLSELMRVNADMSDLVGSITLHEDPVGYQRRSRAGAAGPKRRSTKG